VGKCEPTILVFGGFRVHLLLPNDVVGSIIDGQPTFKGLTEAGGTFFRGSREILHVERKDVTTTVTALAELWIQEPGLSVKIAGGGEWRGVGPKGHYVKTTAGVDGWLPLEQKDARKSTVHFHRVRSNPDYCVAVDYRENGTRWRFRSDGGFSRLLNGPQPLPSVLPWPRAQVFGRDYKLAGTVTGTTQLLGWELAGHPDSDWLNLLGWKGGAGAVVQNVPPYRADQILHPGVPIDRLWDPRSWRRMRPGDSIAQTLTMRKLAR
jgi:hypothetical protein